MKKFLTQSLLVIFVLFVSCSKKHDPAAVAITECQLTGTTAPNETIEYLYSSLGLVDTIRLKFQENRFQASIAYDGQGHLLDIFDHHQHSHFETGANGLPSTATIHLSDRSGEDSVLIWTVQYNYTNAGLIDTVRYDQYTYRRYEFDSSGNLSKYFAKAGVDPEAIASEYLDYDDKNSPYTAIPFVVSIFGDLSGSQYFTVDYDPAKKSHNFLTYKSYSNVGATTLTYFYTYNDADYPVTISTGGTPASFQYECK